MALEKEIETFNRLLPHLLTQQGKFVLIQGDQLAGTYNFREEALDAGYKAFALAPFLVKEIQAVEKTIFLHHFNV